MNPFPNPGPGLRKFPCLCAAAFVAGVLLLGACAPVRQTPPPSLPLLPNAEEILARFDLRKDNRILLRAVAQANINTETTRYPLTLAIIAQRPASLRLEAIPVIGLPNFFLSVRQEKLAVYLPQSGEYYAGRATPENLARFSPVPLSAAELAALLTGCRPDPPAAASPVTIRGYREEKSYRLEIFSSTQERLQSLWIDPGSGNLTRFAREEREGTQALNAYFEDHGNIDGYALPRRIRLQSPGENPYSIELYYAHVTLEAASAATDGLFALPAPAGAKIIALD